MAGYSGTPLAKKLGIDDASTVAILGPAPALPVRATANASAPFDVVLSFLTAQEELFAGIASWGELITPSGGLWICWPKKTARKVVPSDMTEDSVREAALPRGLVDNKVCAIDDVWSGLRVVWRVELRAARAPRSRVPGSRVPGSRVPGSRVPDSRAPQVVRTISTSHDASTANLRSVTG